MINLQEYENLLQADQPGRASTEETREATRAFLRDTKDSRPADEEQYTGFVIGILGGFLYYDEQSQTVGLMKWKVN